MSFFACGARNAHEILRIHLKLEKIELLIGSSLGGQQAQEFAIILAEKLKNLILIATNAFHSPFGIAFNEAQRMALRSDPTFLICNEIIRQMPCSSNLRPSNLWAVEQRLYRSR